MKLSLGIIYEKINTPDNSVLFLFGSNTLNLERPVYYTGENVLNLDTLYICRGTELNKVQKVEKGVSCICCGRPQKRIEQKLEGLIVVPEDTDLLDLGNRVNAVFNQFDLWESELLRTSNMSQFRQMNLRILEVSSGIFENGLAIMGPDMEIVFQNETNILYGGYQVPDPHAEVVIVPDEIISAFKYDEDYRRISEEKQIFYYEGEMLPHRVLCKNLFQGKKFLFRIIITECIRPFRKTDELLLDYLSDHVLRSLQQYSPHYFSANEGLVLLLSEALETGKSNRQAINSELLKLSWSSSNTYRVVSVQVSSFDLYISTLNYYSGEIARLFPAAFAFPFQDRIVLIINETKSGPLETYSDILSVFIRENNFRVGISNYSDDLFSIQTMDRQAEMALTIGLSEKPMVWIHWFSRYTLQYIYNMLTSNTDLGQLYSPIYYRLERYDKENGTSYLETLRVYLKCRMNTVQAAKDLFIQRSTMIYRLKRIREITDNNLEDPDDLLHLYLTFSIIEREENQKER